MASQQTIEFPPKNAASSTNVETEPIWNEKIFSNASRPFRVTSAEVLAVLVDRVRVQVGLRNGAPVLDQVYADLIGTGPHVTAAVDHVFSADQECVVRIALEGGQLPGNLGLITAFLGVEDA